MVLNYPNICVAIDAILNDPTIMGIDRLWFKSYLPDGSHVM